jgi:hypothetical protein
MRFCRCNLHWKLDFATEPFYRQIIAGDYNSDYAGIVKVRAPKGTLKMELRIGYEFNGNFMPWAPGNSSSPTVNADFIAAWQLIAIIVQAAGQADDIQVDTVWNPIAHPVQTSAFGEHSNGGIRPLQWCSLQAMDRGSCRIDRRHRQPATAYSPIKATRARQGRVGGCGHGRLRGGSRGAASENRIASRFRSVGICSRRERHFGAKK